MGRIAVLGCLALLFAAAPAPAAADRGVSISLGSIKVSVPLRGGEEYRLPKLFVSNPGDEASSYVMDGGPIANEADLGPDPAWFVFDPPSFSLDPGARREVAVVIRLPSDARSGQYVGLIRAALGTAGQSGGILGAAAATRLTFTVESGPASLIGALIDSIAAAAPWSWIAIGALLLTILVVGIRRRFNFRIERRS